MKFLKNYVDKQKKKSFWAKLSDVLFILLIVGLLIPSTRTPIMVFLKKLTNFAPSVSVDDDYGKLNHTDYIYTIEGQNGKIYQLKDFSDKPILLNFWATWCPPCIAEMPSIERLEQEYGERVHFIFISNEDQQTVQSFLYDHQYKFKSYKPLSSEPEKLSATSLPTTYIISKDGRIVVKKTGNKKWDSDGVKELLEELISD